MKILTFDQALTTGWCLMHDGILLRYGCVSMEPKKRPAKIKVKNSVIFDLDAVDFMRRIHPLRKFVRELIEETSPDLVVFESVQDNHNHDVHTKLSILLSMLCFVCEDKRQKYFIYNIPSWKSKAGIKLKKDGPGGKKINTVRDEQKDDAIEIVKRTFGFCVKSDEADAICMAYAFFNDIDRIDDFYV